MLLLILLGCGDPQPDELPAVTATGASPVEDTVAAEPDPAVPEDVYDRHFVFISLATDSTVLVPWSFRTRVRPESERTRRRGQVWLSRGPGWESLAREEADAPLTRNPWQLLPIGPIRVAVGVEDRIEGLRLATPGRELETRIDGFITDWVRPGGDPVWLSEGRTLFPSGPVEGFVLEINRRWVSPDGVPGDWIFLHAGPVLQLFLEAVSPLPLAQPEGAFRGWSRLAFQNAFWTGIQVSWEDPRPFEPARRDIPSGWSLGTLDGEIVGNLQAVGSHLVVGEGDGPILPVSGFFEVAGTVTIRGESFDVTGIVRHEQR